MPADSGPDQYIVVVGASTGDREEALAGLAGVVPGRGPDRAADRLRARLPAGRPRPGAGRGDAAASGRDHARAQRRAAAAAPRRGRDPRPRRHAEHDARPDRGLARPRAGIRRRRQPRATHPAGDPAHRAGAGRAPAAIARGAARGDRVGGRGGGPPLAPRRGPAGDRALGPGAAADQARAGPSLDELLERVRDRFQHRAPRTRPRDQRRGARRRPGASSIRSGSSRRSGNLVDNALRHGEGRISLGASANGDGAQLWVADEGNGPGGRASRIAPSSASPAPTRAAPAAAPGWGWRSCARSRGRTAARCARRELGSC